MNIFFLSIHNHRRKRVDVDQFATDVPTNFLNQKKSPEKAKIMETTKISISEIRLYCGTYTKYNNGSISGKWLNLSDYSDGAEFMQACKDLHEDETDAEFMFQDYECPTFLKSLFSESMNDDDLQTIYDAVEAIADSHLDEDVIAAYIENVGIN